MIEKEYSNDFRFSLTQGQNILCEKIFDAGCINPFTRNFVDIRDILPRIITKLQKVLSKRNYDTVLYDIDLYDHYSQTLNQYPPRLRKLMQYNPESLDFVANDDGYEKHIVGVECKIGLYINNKTIVERIFYVDGFNTMAIYSTDLLYAVEFIVETIFNKIKKNDIKNIWDDNYLIKVCGMSYYQVRELSSAQRERLLEKAI